MYDRMWENLQSDPNGADRVNMHWLTLLYAMFAMTTSTPVQANTTKTNGGRTPTTVEQQRRVFFLHALTGRRLAEDMLCLSTSSATAPSPVQEGTVYGCLAVILLANYMCDRGNASEAWRMLGPAIRSAESLGLQRNPAWHKWKGMSKDEQELRRIAWQLLRIHDG